MTSKCSLTAFAAALGTFMLCGCAGDGSGIPILGDEPSGPFPARLSAIQASVLTPTCSAGCHEPGGIAPFSMQNQADSYANLVNTPNSEGATDRQGRILDRVEPRSPARSYIILKLRGAPGIVGDRMPLGQAPLDEEVIETIEEWIRSGALDD